MSTEKSTVFRFLLFWVIAPLLLTVSHEAKAVQRWVGNCAPPGAITYPNLKLAISSAQNGDEVVICPGSYNGAFTINNINNLTIRGSTDNSSDVTINGIISKPIFLIKNAARVTIRNLTLSSLYQRGIDIDGTPVSVSNNYYTFINLKIETVGEGIYLDKSGASVYISSAEIESSRNSGVYLNKGSSDSSSSLVHVIKSSKIKAKSYGVFVKGKADLDDIEVVASGLGIVCNSCIQFKLVRSSIDSGFVGVGITQDQATSGPIEIDQTFVNAKEEGIWITRNKRYTLPNWKITNSSINAINKEAIKLETGSQGGVGYLTFQNLILSSSPARTALFVSTNNHAGEINRVCVKKGKNGVLLNLRDTIDFTIKNSRFQVAQLGVFTASENIGRKKTKVSDSCFFTPYYMKANADLPGHQFDGNYWQGVGGGITYNASGTVIDHRTLGSCPVAETDCAPIAAGPHHIRIETDGSATTCQREAVTFRACADAACTTQYNGDVTFNLVASAGTWTTAGGTPVSNPVTIPGTIGSITYYLNHTAPGTVTVNASGITPSPSGAPQVVCSSGGGAPCTITFTNCPARAEACHNPTSGHCPASGARLYTRLTSNGSDTFTFTMFDSGNNPVVLNGQVTAQVIARNSNVGSGYGTNGCFSEEAAGGLANVTFTNSASASAPLPFPAGAFREAKIKVMCPAALCPPSGLTVCSSDRFAIRPPVVSSVNLAPPLANADTTSGSNSSAPPTFKAGSSPFGIQAVVSVSNYTGILKIDNSKLLAHSGSVAKGEVSPAVFPAATQGSGSLATSSVTNNTFTYSEVGYFKINQEGVYDDTWTAIDQPNDCTNDFSNTKVGEKYGCKFGNTNPSSYFGRFIPHDFWVEANSYTPACISGGFSYYGQDGLSVTFRVQARNASGGITQNYQGPYAKLATASWSNFAFAASPSLPSGVSLGSGSPSLNQSWAGGEGSVTARFVASRPSSAPVPEAIVRVQAKPTDSDAVTASSPMPIMSGTTRFRYGRLVLGNVHGSEFDPLQMPFEAQYWNGSAWATNTLDSCSNISSTLVFDKNPASMPTPTGGAVTNGKGVLNFTAPGIPGSVVVCTNLGADSDNPLAACRSGAAFPWLQGSWDGDNQYNDNSWARATFGLYTRGNSPIMYRRENF